VANELQQIVSFIMAASIAVASYIETLSEKIASRKARVGIVGLGYVGLPLAVEFAKAGFAVTGIDVLESKVARINAGNSYVQDVPTEAIYLASSKPENCARQLTSKLSKNWTHSISVFQRPCGRQKTRT